jgi:anti-sigma regulatory factor (Ser/Thr protein kinase)
MHLALSVQHETDTAEIRRRAVGVAETLSFHPADLGRVALVATELATNLLKHAGRGEILLGPFENGVGVGVECIALDKGPGMADVRVAMRDGYSTRGSPGTGLGAIARQSDEVDIYSRPNGGTAALARLLRTRPRRPLGVERVGLERPGLERFAFGAVRVARQGEETCGDAWSVRSTAGGAALMVIDGLGHGPVAAAAAVEGLKVFEAGASEPPGRALERMHGALRATRGAAASIAEIRTAAGTVVFAGIGNVAGALVSGGGTRRMVSHNGTLGHAIKRVQEFVYPFDGEPLVVLASDGLATGWSLDPYPGLARSMPTLVAAVLYRDFARGNDDATILVGRGEA